MRLWGGDSDTGCCSVSDVDDARRVAQQLDIDHLVFNFTEDFDAAVVAPYVQAHAVGVTPNPCIECNRRVKFARLAERADVLGFDAVATGHHARVERRGRPLVAASAAPTGRRTRATSCTCSARPSSPARCSRSGRSPTRPSCGRWPRRSACAPPPSPTARTSASSRRPAGATTSCAAGSRSTRPRVVDTAGTPLGEVAAVELVTIGQRKGLGLPGGGPKRFVRRRRPGRRHGRRRLRRPSCCDRRSDVGEVTWVDGPSTATCSCSAAPTARRARRRSSPGRAASTCGGTEPQRRVAPGQSVVFYDPADRFVLGGGIAA